MPVYFDEAKGRWRYQFNRKIAGVRHRYSQLLPKAWNRLRAEKYAREKEGKLYALATGIEREEPLVDEAVKLYCKHKTPKQKGGKKADNHLAKLGDYYEGRKISELPDISREFAEDKHGLSSGTVHNRLQYLKAACRYAWRSHWKPKKVLDHDPTTGMDIPPANNARQVYAKLPQLMKLWKSFDDPEARAVFRIAFYAGLRWMADLMPRKPEDVQKLNGGLWLNIGTTKNGSPILKPIHPEIQGDLKYLPFKRHPRTYYASFEEARIKAGIAHHTAHDLRHSLASIILSNPGGSLADVQGALHQKTAASANRYAHLYPERLRKVMFSVGKSQKNAHRRSKKALVERRKIA